MHFEIWYEFFQNDSSRKLQNVGILINIYTDEHVL